MTYDSLLLPSGRLNLGSRRFERADGIDCALTTGESRFLRYMADHIDSDVSRDALLVDVWGFSPTSLSRSVDSTVKRLRKKLELDPQQPESLLTVFGDGYRLRSHTPIATQHPIAPVVPATIQIGSVCIDPRSGRIRRGSATCTLSTQQRALLRLLLEAHGEPVSSGAIGRRLGMAQRHQRSVRTAIYRLRQILEDDPQHPQVLLHIPGCGYLIEDTLHPSSPLQDARQALWQLTAHAGRSLGLPDCVLYVRRGNDLVQTAAWGPKTCSPMRIESPITLRLGEGIVGFVASQRASENVRDVRSDPRYVADSIPARSELAVPIVHHGTVVGVIDAESPRPEAFGARELVALQAIGDLASQLAANLGERLRQAG